MKTQNLFGQDGDEAPKKRKKGSVAGVGKPRLRRAERAQVTLVPFDLDSLVEDDHPVRTFWSFVSRLDLRPFLDRIAARGSAPGRAATDPAILLTVWLYGTHKKVGSSHELARLCEDHKAYRWLCGGVSLNQHTLSDFRSTNTEAFDEVLTELLATLLRNGVLSVKRVAHDGMKVRASAGQGSFRRQPSLEDSLKLAKKRVKAAKKSLLDPTKNQRKAAAKERAAREREERVERAIAELPEVRKANSKRKEPHEARVSTTDPDARVMRMGDGGFRPAYNVQIAADTETRLVVGVTVTNCGSDYGQLEPMLGEIERMTGEKPKEILVDGGYVNHAAFDAASRAGTKVFCPPGRARKGTKDDPYEPKPTDSTETKKWRRRMKTEKAKEIYKERAATIETVNADLKTHRGLDRLTVRGLDKASSVFLLGVLSYNALRLIALDALWGLA